MATKKQLNQLRFYLHSPRKPRANEKFVHFICDAAAETGNKVVAKFASEDIAAACLESVRKHFTSKPKDDSYVKGVPF